MNNKYIIFLSLTKYYYWLQGCKTFVVKVWIKILRNVKWPKGFKFHWPSLNMCYNFDMFKQSEIHKEGYHTSEIFELSFLLASHFVLYWQKQLCFCCGICRFWKLTSVYRRKYCAVASLPPFGHFSFTSVFFVT